MFDKGFHDAGEEAGYGDVFVAEHAVPRAKAGNHDPWFWFVWGERFVVFLAPDVFCDDSCCFFCVLRGFFFRDARDVACGKEVFCAFNLKKFVHGYCFSFR